MLCPDAFDLSDFPFITTENLFSGLSERTLGGHNYWGQALILSELLCAAQWAPFYSLTALGDPRQKTGSACCLEMQESCKLGFLEGQV